MSKKITRKQRNTRIVPTHNEYIAETKLTLKELKPITNTMEVAFDLYYEDYSMALIGSAGTGKTMSAMYLALEDVTVEKNYDRIIIIRTAVQSRDQGFMPGSLDEKMSYYEGPYIDIVNELYGKKDAYRRLKDKGVITFMSSSFVRGLTFDNAIIIFDECQNANYDELRSIITRVGNNSKIIFCGDTKQDDLKSGKNRNDKSGLGQFLEVLDSISEFRTVKFTVGDVVRSGLVKAFILAEEEVLAA